jgi:stalled ribosome rescue protein Dom34
MSNPYHAIVWMDHKEAKIFALDGDLHYVRVDNPSHDERIHHHAGSIGSGHRHENTEYLRNVATALAAAHEIVVTGPAQAKIELMDWIKRHAPQIAAKVLGVETLDHPTHGEILAFAKRYFHAKDRMTPQLP